MDTTLVAPIATSVVLVAVVTLTWRVVNWVWLRPKKLEKWLREQGLHGNPYRLLKLGDLTEFFIMTKEAKPRPISLSDDIAPHVLPYHHHIINKYGKKSFMWLGPTPVINIVEPELVKEVMSNHRVFQKPHTEAAKMITLGLVTYEGEKWAKHRKIINPAFHLEKLKVIFILDEYTYIPLYEQMIVQYAYQSLENMLPAIYQCCRGMMDKWEEIVSAKGSCEVDVCPYVEELSAEVIARTTLGNSSEEGRKIFELQKEKIDSTLQLMLLIHIPGWRFLPTKANKRMKQIRIEEQTLIKRIVDKREKEMKMGEVSDDDDLLRVLLESNLKEIREHGNNKSHGMSIEEVMEECKEFFFAGADTTKNLLVWTMVLLSKHPNWQACAREEVTMILHEVLRLYPPVTFIYRATIQTTKLGNMTLPAGVHLSLPTVLLHHDKETWGEDAEEFKPDRFSGGVYRAIKSQVSFLPFSWGPRICIGQNFAMIQVKMALAIILQHFSFELSPSYIHAPFPTLSLQPQFAYDVLLAG
ncbi:unnamed protein product [Ilex paraguariensis]|uniref:Cytochrome P450 n=1 Tax=Ilex paraguariensis TaxID=185542 RepID=A0ABC8S3N3_9AQUA